MVKQISKIYNLTFLLFFAVIPFTEHFQAAPNVLIGILIILFPFVIKKADWKILKTITFFSYLVLVIAVLISILIKNSWNDFDFLFRILIVPIILILSLPIIDFKKLLYSFLIGSGSLLVISAINLTIHYLRFQDFKIDVGREVNKLIMGERPFLGFIYLISFCICFYLAKYEKNIQIKRLFYALAIIYSAFILLISARLSILSLIIILGVSVFFNKKKIKSVIISFATVFLISVFAILNPNFISRFTAGFKQKEFNMEKIISMEPRTHIWACSIKIGDPHIIPILGYGFRGSIDKLTDCYANRDKFLNENHKQYFVDSRFNSHNQFLNFYLSSGILTMLLFVFYFFLLFKANKKYYFTFSLVLALFLFCFLENTLSRQIGAGLFGSVVVFLSLFQKEHSSDVANKK